MKKLESSCVKMNINGESSKNNFNKIIKEIEKMLIIKNMKNSNASLAENMAI